MARYDVHVFCDFCSDNHRMPIVVTLDDGPAERDSIGNHWEGKELPESIVSLKSNVITCPTTGRHLAQEDNNQIYLVARAG